MDFDAICTYCRSLPSVTEDIKWDHDLCFSIGGKMFLVMYTGQPFSCSFKVLEEEFEELAASPHTIPAPYMARNKWVQVQSEGRFTRKEWEHYIAQSYRLVREKLPKKVQAGLGPF